jgi:hypothetical protein
MQNWDARVAAEEKNHASNLIYGLPSVSSSLSRLVYSYEESISHNVQQTHTHTHTLIPLIMGSKMPRQGTNQEYLYFQKSCSTLQQ